MTINLLRGKGPKSTPERDAALKSLAIGATEANVFNCPSCGRPLSEGTSRCPACGVTLVMGVMLRQAAAILGLGMVFGMLIGGAVTASAITLSLHDTKAVVAVVPTAAPMVATPAPTAIARATGGAPAAVSGLSGTAVVNGRIALDAVTLRDTIAKPHGTTIDIARALRSLSADAALGNDLVDRLVAWRAAEPVMSQLNDFYTAVAATAQLGLRASLTDDGAYRDAAAQMDKVLLGLSGVDSASRALAATVNLELPPVVMSPAPSANPAASTAP